MTFEDQILNPVKRAYGNKYVKKFVRVQAPANIQGINLNIFLNH